MYLCIYVSFTFIQLRLLQLFSIYNSSFILFKNKQASSVCIINDAKIPKNKYKLLLLNVHCHTNTNTHTHRCIYSQTTRHTHTQTQSGAGGEGFLFQGNFISWLFFFLFFVPPPQGNKENFTCLAATRTHSHTHALFLTGTLTHTLSHSISPKEI